MADEIYSIACEMNERMVNHFKACREEGSSGDELYEILNEMDDCYNCAIDRNCTLQRLWESTLYMLCNADRNEDALNFITKSYDKLNNIGTSYIMYRSIFENEWKTVRWLLTEKNHPINTKLDDKELKDKFNLIFKKDLDELVKIFGERVKIWRPGTKLTTAYPPYAL